MTVSHEVEEKSSLEQNDLTSLNAIILDQLGRKPNSTVQARKSEKLLDYFTNLIAFLLDSQFARKKEQTLYLIDLLDKLNTQRDLLEIKRDNMKISDLRAVSKRLGKKSQSGLETKF